MALPGDYAVTLTVNGRAYRAPLHLSEDPRVQVAPADLAASLALSQRIAAALGQARIGYGEVQAVETRIDALFPAPAAAASPASPATKQDAAGDLPDQARTLASGLRQPPATGAPPLRGRRRACSPPSRATSSPSTAAPHRRAAGRRGAADGGAGEGPGEVGRLQGPGPWPRLTPAWDRPVAGSS